MSAAHADIPHLTAENTTVPAKSLWRKFPFIGIGAGVACLALAFFLGKAEGAHPYAKLLTSYLTSYMFWLSIALGSLFFVIIQHGVRAGWSVVVRRIAENWMIVLPILGLLAAPIVLGKHELFHWSHPSPDDFILQKKIAYYDETFYNLRSLGMVLVWALLATALYRWSTKQDKTGDHALTHKMRWWAPLGFVAFGITITIASIDWMMSLDPHWYSTIFGIYYFAGSVMASAAAIILGAMALQKAGLLKDAITTEHYHDLGKWMFGFIVFWAYIGFSQFILIWYANIPEETLWYKHRIEHGWEVLSLVLPIVHFLLPFFFLMSRHIKRRRLFLAIGASWLLFAHYVDMFWVIQPSALHLLPEDQAHFAVTLTDILCLVGLGGITVGLYAFFTTRNPVVPVKDPRLEESLKFENY